MSSATGRRCGPACGPAAGPFNTPTRIIPISTTPPWWRWRSTASTASAIALPSTAPPNGSSACRAATAAGARSTPTTRITTSTTSRSPITARCSIRRPRMSAPRCVGLLAQLGDAAHRAGAAAGLAYLRREQEPDGSWFGRWGTNYIYGTWSVLAALQRRAASTPRLPRCAAPSTGCSLAQRADGGWGETEAFILGRARRMARRRTAPRRRPPGRCSALMAAGEIEHPAVERGVAYLLATQNAGRRLGRAVVHRGRFPARVLSALSRLPRLFPAVGAGALSPADGRHRAARAVRSLITNG